MEGLGLGCQHVFFNNFFDVLQQALASIAPHELFALICDCNTWVGVSKESNIIFRHVQGPHGYGKNKNAGKELHSLLVINEVNVCNTWLTKRDIYKQTWQHSKSKK